MDATRPMNVEPAVFEPDWQGPGAEATPAERDKRLQGIKTLLGVVTNKSRAQRVAKCLCGPLGRVWERDGVFQVGEQRPDGNEVYGQGKTWEEAFLEATRELSLEEFADLAGREIRAIAITQNVRGRARCADGSGQSWGGQEAP